MMSSGLNGHELALSKRRKGHGNATAGMSGPYDHTQREASAFSIDGICGVLQYFSDAYVAG